MSFDHDMQMKVKDEVIKNLESQLKEANEKYQDLFTRYGELDEMNIVLNEKLAESEKWKHEWQTTPVWKVFENNKQLKQRLQEAEEVVRFYGDHGNWLYNQIAKTKDVSLITSDIPKGLEFESGGKRAREFLKKIEAKEEV